MEDPLVAALRLLCEKEGGYKAVADKAGVNDQSIYQIISGVKLPSGQPKGVGPTIRRKLSTAFPGWSGDTPEPRGTSPVAHELIHRVPIVEPRTLIWGGFVLEDVRGEFIMAIGGDALAPHYLPGQRGIWEACDAGRPGKAVLLVDRDGEFHLRIYEPRGGASWAGISDWPGHRELQPERDGVRIVARIKWRAED